MVSTIAPWRNWLLATLLAAWIIVFAWITWATLILLPFWDAITWIADFQRDGFSLAGLWTPHNEHHLVFARLLTGLAWGPIGLGGGVFVTAGLASLVAIAWLLARESQRDGGWVAAALVLMTRASPALRAAALACALLAGVGNAVGLAVWPVLLVTAWRIAGWRWLAATLAVTLLSAVIFSRGTAAGGEGTLADLAGRIFPALDYLLGFLGLPISRAPSLALPGRVLGAVLLLAALAIMARFWIGPVRSTAQKIAPGLAGFTLLAGLLAAFGRADMGGIPVRYALLVAPLHAAIVLAAAPWIAASWARPRRAGLLLAGLVLLLAVQVVGGHAAIAQAHAIRAAIAAFLEGDRGPEAARIVFPDPDYAASVLGLPPAR